MDRKEFFGQENKGVQPVFDCPGVDLYRAYPDDLAGLYPFLCDAPVRKRYALRKYCGDGVVFCQRGCHVYCAQGAGGVEASRIKGYGILKRGGFFPCFRAVSQPASFLYNISDRG